MVSIALPQDHRNTNRDFLVWLPSPLQSRVNTISCAIQQRCKEALQSRSRAIQRFTGDRDTTCKSRDPTLLAENCLLCFSRCFP